MKKLITMLTLLILVFSTTFNSIVAKPVAVSVFQQKMKKDGTPDKRYKANKHLKSDGTPDKRYKENKSKKS